jgi:U3 small nucleolar RNA-associated protein 14
VTPTTPPIDSQPLSVSRSQLSRQSQGEHNPWLSRNGQSSHTTLKKSEIAVSKDSKGVVKAKNKLQKRQKETEDEAKKVQDDAILDISSADLLVESSKNCRQSTPDHDHSDAADEVEEQEESLKQKGKLPGRTYNVFKQKDLVAKAFAGDNVVKVRVYLMSFWCNL